MANNNPDAEAQGNGQAESTPGNSAAKQSVNTAPPPPLQKQASNTLVPTTTSSAGASPRTSRNTSPVRKDSRQQPLSNTPSTQPSAAAIQRALSAASVPQLPAGGVSDAMSKLPKPPQKNGGASGDTTPRWPTSPRLKSPPPSATNSRRNSSTAQKKTETTAAPSINVQSATPNSPTPPPSTKQGVDETAKAQQQLQTPVKGPSRGASGKSTLETVQENSADDVKEPSPAAVRAAADLKPLTRLDQEEKAEAANGETETTSLHAESGSESAGAKTEKKKDQESIAQRPKNGTTKSYASLASSKSRQPEGKQNMTVETETVPSIPQSAIAAGDRSGGTRNENSGSVRLKPSNETIRPKKERKKPTQKARSINQGTAREDDSTTAPNSPAARSYSHHLRHTFTHRTSTSYSVFRTFSNKFGRKASSKADIFEARVANAVDEANSSDSEETFVYESNPPEPQRRARHHSRTPSVTSSHSVADGQRSAGMRSFGDVMDERRVAGKRSMKFSNNAYNDIDSPDAKDGSVRSHTPRHFGRFGRGGSHASMFDPDSPFTQASKLRSQQMNLRHSRPGSPRSPQSVQQQRMSGLFGKKQEPSSFDFDAEGGDDERTPLVGTVRTPRNGRLPRRISSHGAIDPYYGVRRHSRFGRFGGCMLGFVVFAAAILSAIAFLVMSNRPMYEVEIRKIQNVLASEQELMLDLLVGAVNPNALGIAVTDMDVNIFAKSKHVGTGEMWRERRAAQLTTSESVVRERRKRQALPPVDRPTLEDSNGWKDLSNHWHAPPGPHGGVDEGTDPPDDDDLGGDTATMLLGRIVHFDQGLEFEGSPLKRHLHYSVGELRLEKPGNKTETGGSARWEKVLQYPFELIIRGVLKYQLPISSRVETAAVGASVLVHPEDGVDPTGAMRVEEVDHTEYWQWIDWEDVVEEDKREGRGRV
ncbi:Vacuolar inheritance and morphology protein [Saxophila tyrrhenica]|uniref:Vacuolar inheritance and morphology protein n=1 Tax=Saxophila tyrrhenica TaxID=1690608 RepID=A0AAV9P8A8_9PEZI|nr:Vacuolar inheritance and morphology protein [Saxophila tyrrhenica]